MGWVIIIVVAMVLDFLEGRTGSKLLLAALTKARGKR